MFKPVEKNDINQISLTGLRAIILFGLLIEKPRTLEEIKTALIEYKIMEPTSSDDVIGIDINTLRHMGCDITRRSAKNGGKHELLAHPFSIKIEEDELKILKKIYRFIKKQGNLETLIKYDDFFKKISKFVSDEETREFILGISALKHLKIDLVNELIEDCKQQKTLLLEYKKTARDEPTEKEIIARKIEFKNENVYLQGFDLSMKLPVMLNIKRILKIISRTNKKEYTPPELLKIKFLLNNSKIDILEENETILEKYEDKSLVEGGYFNKFYATQRMLYLGSDCIVLEPTEFRDSIIKKLIEMRNIYE